MIFADAARADSRAVGKFIISMCQNPSDIMTVLVMMKLTGMMETSKNQIVKCPFDVTGLFETIEDLKEAPRIVTQLLSIQTIREYIVHHRNAKLIVMLGYSDSVRDGSNFSSHMQVAYTTLALKSLEAKLNENLPKEQQIELLFYRGRGDSPPRGFNGSVAKAIMSQILTSGTEDVTEQNRYLRRYATVSSTLNHLHVVYSAHVNTRVKKLPSESDLFMTFFEFYGKISNLKWNQLVKETNGGKGKTYFDILNKYSILLHLPKSNFASRPVARDGVTYNIDSVRAIPFTMALAQMREFTSAYYGFGTAMEIGTSLLSDYQNTVILLLKSYMETLEEKDQSNFKLTLLSVENRKEMPHLVRCLQTFFKDQLSTFIDQLLQLDAKQQSHNATLSQVHKCVSSS